MTNMTKSVLKLLLKSCLDYGHLHHEPITKLYSVNVPSHLDFVYDLAICLFMATLMLSSVLLISLQFSATHEFQQYYYSTSVNKL